jgi:membrane-associated phospholipid phosphatase
MSIEWSLENIISMSVILVYLVPGILYFYTGNVRELFAMIGVLATVTTSEGIKYMIVKERNPRPKGARDCNLLCTDGLQEGRPGMPSGHSAMAAFFAAFYINETEEIWVKILIVVFAISIMYSRYKKRCHSLEQIVVGCLFGIVCAMLTQKLRISST